MSVFKSSRSTILRSEEMRAFPAGVALPPYCLRRSSRRRGLALKVDPNGGIVVNAPIRLAQENIDQFITQHTAWIKTRLSVIQSQVFHWLDGAELPWRGGTLTLLLLPASSKPLIKREEESLYCAAPAEAAASLVKKWYQQQAKAVLAERLALHAARARLSVPPLRVSDARTRWGSLSAKGVVSLNWRLIKASPVELDYVVCHELAHFRQRNHSPAFWREVAALFPDYNNVRAKLRSEGQRYFAF